MRIKRMSKNNTFIKCSDKETIEQLEKLGYRKVSDTNGIAVFINDPSKPQTYAKKNVVYSSIMTMA